LKLTGLKALDRLILFHCLSSLLLTEEAQLLKDSLAEAVPETEAARTATASISTDCFSGRRIVVIPIYLSY